MSDDEVFGSLDSVPQNQNSNQNVPTDLLMGGQPVVGEKFPQSQSPQQNPNESHGASLLSDEDVFGPSKTNQPTFEGNNTTDPGYLTRIKNDLVNRNSQVRGAVDQFGVGPSALLAGVGKGVAGSVNDIVGETVKSGYNSLPDMVRQPINDAATKTKDYLVNTDAGKYLTGKAGELAQGYDQFAKDNPRTANALESTGDIVGAAANLIPIGKGAAAGVELAGKGVNAAKDGLTAVKDFAKTTTIGKGATARLLPEELETAGNVIKDRANGSYKVARDSGAILTSEAGQQLVTDVRKSLGRVSERRHGDTLSILDDMEEAAKKGQLSLDDLDDFRQDLREVHNDHTDFTGRTKSDGAKASSAINELDELVNGLKNEHLASGDTSAFEALANGRAQWAQYRKFDQVAHVIKSTGGDPNKLKAAMTRFLNNPKNTRGFSDNEIAALRSAAANTTGEKLLKSLGKFGIDLGTSVSPGNTALPALTGFTGLGTGHGVPMVAAGTVARQGQKYLARGKVENLLQTIEQNSERMNNPGGPIAGESRGGPVYMANGGRVLPLRPRTYSVLEARKRAGSR